MYEVESLCWPHPDSSSRGDTDTWTGRSKSYFKGLTATYSLTEPDDESFSKRIIKLVLKATSLPFLKYSQSIIYILISP